jgi:4,5-dihydroxyphthalate decarboxylase
MSRPLRLSCALGASDLNQGLLDGSVTVPGVELTAVTYSSPERHWRMLRHEEFDICEVSLGTFLGVNERDPGRFVAIPAFPHRRFRHSSIYVAADSGVTDPAELAGGRIGLRTWTNTAGVWTRGILQDEYGLDLTGVRWVIQDEDTAGSDRIPSHFHVDRVPPGESVVTQTARGELDALIYPEIPSVLNEPSGLRRLFGDARAEEASYFERTGIFPIMHTVVIRAEVAEAHPWLVYYLLRAFRASKDAALAQVADPRRTCLAWVRDTYEQQRAVLGPDPWAYDARTSAPSLQALFRYALEQGIVARLPSANDLFHPATLDEPPQYVRS